MDKEEKQIMDKSSHRKEDYIQSIGYDQSTTKNVNKPCGRAAR